MGLKTLMKNQTSGNIVARLVRAGNLKNININRGIFALALCSLLMGGCASQQRPCGQSYRPEQGGGGGISRQHHEVVQDTIEVEAVGDISEEEVQAILTHVRSGMGMASRNDRVEYVKQASHGHLVVKPLDHETHYNGGGIPPASNATSSRSRYSNAAPYAPPGVGGPYDDYRASGGWHSEIGENGATRNKPNSLRGYDQMQRESGDPIYVDNPDQEAQPYGRRTVRRR